MEQDVSKIQDIINSLTSMLPTLSGQNLTDALDTIHRLNKRMREIRPICHNPVAWSVENNEDHALEDPPKFLIAERTKTEIQKISLDLIEKLSSEIESCESPIEQMLGAWLYYLAHIDEIFDDGCFNLNPQYEIKARGGKVFRVDFCVALSMGGEHVSLVVECDGHDFHEKTKEQAQRDKSRDRLLKLVGNDVIRFTGSEIWADPRKCAEEIISLLRQKRRELRVNGRVD